MIRLLLLLVALVSVELSADFSNTATRIYLETKNGYQLNQLRFGINSEATNSLDTAIGEWELPPFPPPEGIHAGFEFLDSNQNEKIISYLDLRPYPGHEEDTIKYVLQTFKGAGDIITIKWNPIGPELQSAFIVDMITEGKLIKINMKDSSEALVNNEFVERFLFLIVYNPNTGVEKEEISLDESSDIVVFPVEFTDRVTISCDNKYTRYEIYNIFGSRAASGIIDSGHAELDLNAFAPGIYFIAVYDNKGSRIIKKIVKS